MRPYRRRRPGGSIRPHLSILFLLLGVLIPLLLREPAPPAPAPLPQGEVLESVRAALPEELEPLRRAFVESGAALAGRVGYFWGGKSDAVGWDARWGVPAVVISPGSDTTGESIPFGLDCSGFVSWCAVNAAGDAAAGAVIGSGVRDQWARCTPVAWDEAQPGDLLVFPDLSHVGIAAGRGTDGKLMVLHCSRSLGGVVCSPDARAVGFAGAGRPAFFTNTRASSKRARSGKPLRANSLLNGIDSHAPRCL